MPETVAAAVSAAAAQGVGQEGPGARPARAERGCDAGVWRKGLLVDGSSSSGRGNVWA
jgi:hypothetical protein